ncbi:hypothetical protein TPY_2078 [Sulfobacillus acidophilus TPY]|nr:hypothetical protein TPY_2078 [Sulfobacillus acidophilus TPY]
MSDDFLIEAGPYMLVVRNAPSPAATAVFAIGAWVVDQARQTLGWSNG